MAYDILIVDDEPDIRVLTSGVLHDEGYETREAADSTTALAAVESRRPSLILLDIWLQGSEMDGLGILAAIKKNHPSIPVVMMSGHGTVETAVAAIKMGAYDFVEKPFTSDRLLLVIERAIDLTRLRRENEELRLRAGPEFELIGQSPAINAMRQIIERVAPTNSRVLITGPAGSGKETAARRLHLNSQRKAGRFIVVNCATMEPDRMEVTLFGTEGGNDETDGPRRVGTFEAAHNGTLFLDEVADMPLETQGKIVRVLQEQNFERVGGSTSVQVDVRVVASTTHDLEVSIAEGRFREDLYYRLNVVPLPVPPLSDRREDIPLLAKYFMNLLAEAAGRPARAFAEDAIAALQSSDWPGNVRELRNVVERLLITAPGGPGAPIRAEHLSTKTVTSDGSPQPRDYGAELMGMPLRQAREIFEREYLLGQVMRFGGNISRTAAFVGMERSALHRKLKSLGVANENKRRSAGS